jgi:hypothetical protein
MHHSKPDFDENVEFLKVGLLTQLEFFDIIIAERKAVFSLKRSQKNPNSICRV